MLYKTKNYALILLASFCVTAFFSCEVFAAKKLAEKADAKIINTKKPVARKVAAKKKKTLAQEAVAAPNKTAQAVADNAPAPVKSGIAAEFSHLAQADYFFLMDHDTKEILLQKNADVRLAPSSMTKIMTAYVVFDQIKQGHITLDNQCLIGKDAWRKSGSSMFLNYGDVVSVNELVKGLLAVSGNDAAMALAESTAGGIDKFVALMNIKAKELGLKNSHFANPHGLNEDGHYMSVHDLGILISRIYSDFPQFAPYLSIEEFTYHSITQPNHNPLIQNNYDGMVGGKTGYTGDGGYGVVGSVKRNNRRLVAVVNKVKTPKLRGAIIAELFDYGFERYKKLTLFEKDQPIAKLKIWMGKSSETTVAPNQEISFNIPTEKQIEAVKVKVEYLGPIYAPVAKGAKIAVLKVEIKNYKTLEYSLFAKENVDKSGYLQRMTQLLRYKTRALLMRFGLIS